MSEMMGNQIDPPPDVPRTQRVAAAGGLIGAVAASSCCMLPLALFTLGAGGPWIGKLVKLAPYQSYFIAASIACLGYGYWLVYRSSRRKCAIGKVGRSSTTNRLVMSSLVLATALVVLAIVFNFLAPLLNS